MSVYERSYTLTVSFSPFLTHVKAHAPTPPFVSRQPLLHTLSHLLWHCAKVSSICWFLELTIIWSVHLVVSLRYDGLGSYKAADVSLEEKQKRHKATVCVTNVFREDKVGIWKKCHSRFFLASSVCLCKIFYPLSIY